MRRPPLQLRPRTVVQLAANVRSLAAHLHGIGCRGCIAFSYPAAFRMALAVRRNGIHPLWFTSFSVDRPAAGQRRWRALALRMIARSGTTAICPSAFAAGELARLGYPARQLRMIPNAIDVQRFAAAVMDAASKREFRRRFGLPQDEFLIVCVARVDPLKNHALLLRALSVARRAGARVSLACLGGVDPGHQAYAEQLRRLSAQLAVSAAVHWLGWQEDVVPWLAAADAAALVSHIEAAPLALLEAGAAGLPLLATAVGGNVEVVLQNQTGLLFQPDEVDACAAAIVRLSRDDNERRRLGQQAQRHVREHFSLARISVTWMEILADVVRDEPSRTSA